MKCQPHLKYILSFCISSLVIYGHWTSILFQNLNSRRLISLFRKVSKRLTTIFGHLSLFWWVCIDDWISLDVNIIAFHFPLFFTRFIFLPLWQISTEVWILSALWRPTVSVLSGFSVLGLEFHQIIVASVFKIALCHHTLVKIME